MLTSTTPEITFSVNRRLGTLRGRKARLWRFLDEWDRWDKWDAMLFRPQHYATETCSANRDSDSVTRLMCCGAILAILAVMALRVDLAVLRFCDAGSVPGDLRRVLVWSELFAHGFGVILLAVTIATLDPIRRRQLPRLLVCALGSGLAANFVKFFVARVRPRDFSADNIWDSFLGWIPAVWPVESYSRFDHRLQSFPSAHTAVAAGLAIGLASIYPRGRFLFILFAVLAAGQRIECSAHFLSDVLAGGAIGCVVGGLCVGRGYLGRVFDRVETRK